MRRRNRILVAFGAVSTLAAAYHVSVRPWILRWGATAEEAAMPLPGDALFPNPAIESTRAVTIEAPPERVWPWLAQIGDHRAGFYSYDLLEHVLGTGGYVEGTRSATRIHPELQAVRAGDTIALAHRPRVDIEIREAVQPEHLVLGSGWAFVLRPCAEGTRMLIRTRGPGWVRGMFHRRVPRTVGAVIDYVVGEPLHHVMERKMLLGIKARAEGPGRRSDAHYIGLMSWK